MAMQNKLVRTPARHKRPARPVPRPPLAAAPLLWPQVCTTSGPPLRQPFALPPRAMAPKRAQSAPRVRCTYSNVALKARLEDALKKIRELQFVNQTLYKRNKKLRTVLKSIYAKADEAIQTGVDDAAAMVLKVQELRDQVQSDSDRAEAPESPGRPPPPGGRRHRAPQLVPAARHPRPHKVVRQRPPRLPPCARPPPGAHRVRPLARGQHPTPTFKMCSRPRNSHSVLARTAPTLSADGQTPPDPMTLVYAGPTLQRLILYFKELNIIGPVLVETGTNESWPKGAEIEILKRNIQRDYSCYTDKLLHIYTIHPESDTPLDVKELCWDEYVINGSPMLTVSTTDLMPPTPTLEYTEQHDLAFGVNLPPMLIFTVKMQETGEWEQVGVPNPAFTGTASPVRALLLKKCLVSQLALAGSTKHTMTERIYRNDAGYCKGEPASRQRPGVDQRLVHGTPAGRHAAGLPRGGRASCRARPAAEQGGRLHEGGQGHPASRQRLDGLDDHSRGPQAFGGARRLGRHRRRRRGGAGRAAMS